MTKWWKYNFWLLSWVPVSVSRSRKLCFMSSLYLSREKYHPSIFVMVYVKSDFVLKKNIRCMAQENHWCFDNTWTKKRNQVFMFGLYIFDLSVECLPQHFRHGLHQIWQIDELFRARLKLWCATIKWPFRTGWPPAVLPNAWALIWLQLWSFLICCKKVFDPV